MKEPIWTISFVLVRVIAVGVVALGYALWPSVPVLVLFIVLFLGSLAAQFVLHRWNR